MWSNPDYSHQLVSCLPSLATLDQQEVSPELRAVARRWAELRQQQPSRQPSPTGDKAVEKSKALLYKKLEERNASITAQRLAGLKPSQYSCTVIQVQQ